MLGRSNPPLCPLGLAWCNGLPTTRNSCKASANHTIDPVIPPIWNSLPRWAVSMNKVQVSVSSPVRWGTWRLWGGDWDLRAFSTSQPRCLFSIQPPQTPQESLPRGEQTQMENGWSTSLPFDCFFVGLLSCVVLCCVFFIYFFIVVVVQVKIVTSVQRTGMQERRSLEMWTLMEYQ